MKDNFSNIDAIAWNTDTENKWNRPSKPASLNTYLNYSYKFDLSDKAQSQITSHDWDIGSVTYNNNNLQDQINDENSSIWNGEIGLIRVSEYLRTNSNRNECETMQLSNKKENNNCYKSNWMYTTLVNTWWTITASNSYSHYVYLIDAGHYDGDTYVRGRIVDNSSDFSSYVRPVVYLSSDIKIISGNGSSSSPYVIE